MNCIRVAVFIIGICATTFAFPQHYEEIGSKVFRITEVEKVENGLEKLLQLQHIGEYDFWTRPRSKGFVDVLIKPEQVADFETYMNQHGFTYSVMIDDVGKLILQQSAGIHNHQDEMDWDNYHRYDTIVNFVRQTALDHFDIASVEEIGATIENRTLIVIKIGAPAADGRIKPAIFMDGGIHAREWISPALTTYFINELVNNNTFYADILNEVDFYIVPVLNADGYEHSHTNVRLWRKNRRPDASCPGVDLNRNYGYQWGGPGSSGSKCSETYRGEAAFSEPESLAMKEFIERKAEEGVNWRAYFAVHSYAQMWLVPWGWTYDLPEDYDDLVTFGQVGVDALTPVHGTLYDVGSVTELLSPGAGGSDDWAKGSGIFKYSQTVEVRDTGRYGFVLPPDQIKPCAEETWAAIQAVSKFLAEE